VVVGDVEPQKVLAWARRHYGALAPKAIPARKTLAEPVQRGMKRVAVKAPAELPYVRLGYKAPVLRDIAKDWEPFAISLLAELLELGELESCGLSFRDAERIAGRLKEITVEQIRAAAARYLVDDGLTVAVLDPQPLNPASSDVTGVKH